MPSKEHSLSPQAKIRAKDKQVIEEVGSVYKNSFFESVVPPSLQPDDGLPFTTAIEVPIVPPLDINKLLVESSNRSR